MFKFLSCGSGVASLSAGSTVIFSPPSYGNAGQLASDLLISTMHKKKCLKFVGSIESVLLLPLSGYESLVSNARVGTSLILPIEIYEIVGSSDSGRSTIYVVQQRSPCVKGSSQQFYSLFKGFLRSISCQCLIVLTGGGTGNIAEL